jgi:hypothetical protein
LGHLTKPCETCAGSGRVKRELRRNSAGAVDPLDILGKFEALCDCCDGSGEVPLDPKTIPEKIPGDVANLTDLTPLPPRGRRRLKPCRNLVSAARPGPVGALANPQRRRLGYQLIRYPQETESYPQK